MKVIYLALNIFLFILSAALITLCSLHLAYGNYDISIFRGYFEHPLILLLNFLPVLLIEVFLYFAINRMWIAFLSTAVIILTASAGNFFKLLFRSDPFMFSDVTAINTALGVAGGYDIKLNPILTATIFSVLAMAAVLFFFAKCRIDPPARVLSATALFVVATVLWQNVYSSDRIYKEETDVGKEINSWISTQVYISKGFVYPFIYSVKDTMDIAPDGYDADEAAALLAEYETSDIPEGRKINVIALQLEAYTDFTCLGIGGICDDVYSFYHQLERESYTGNLITNAFAGSTVNTERCFLTGYPRLIDFRQQTPSYVWYFKNQGYSTVGSHPYHFDYYNRRSVNANLGFDEYYFYEGHYDKMFTDKSYNNDDQLFSDILSIYRENLKSGKPVFSYSVTLQGHGPYITDYIIWPKEYWYNYNNYSEYAYYVMNNYLGSLANTGENISRMIDELRDDEAPVVVVLYGDHKPWLGDNNSVYKELGIDLDLSTYDGVRNYYSTRYLIWANNSAKEIIGEDFAGEGPDISPCYLMNILFERLGWEGNSYMKFTNGIRETLPVVNKQGCYVEGDVYTNKLSPEGQEKFSDLLNVQYYLRNSKDVMS